MESERRSQRYPSQGALQIRCETWTEFVEAYASDICRGGMFIRSDVAPEVLSEIELKLILPGGMEVALGARVVHVVPIDLAEQQNRSAGMGVEFIHVDAEQKRQILQLVEFARAQGEDGDPNASFTRTLLETSASMAPSDVAAKLSMLPDGSGDASAAARIRKASQVAMQAVQLNDDVEPPLRSDPSEVAVRSRALSEPFDQPIVRAPTGPLTDSAGRSNVNTPIVRTQTQPIARAPTQPIVRGQTGPLTGRSSVSTPVVRAPTQPIVRAQTGPLTGRSSASTPVVRTPIRGQTGPLAGAAGRSSASTPIVRTPTGPLTAADSRPNSAPIARTSTGPLGSSSTNPRPPGERTQSAPIDGTPGTPSGNPEAGASGSAPAPNPSDQPLPPSKPTDLNRLKIVVNSLAHKHYEDAAREARSMLVDNPGDPLVLKWQAICFARMALARDEPASAMDSYEKVLRFDENNREAREFVKNFQRDKKLNSLPFGRYFLKKK